MSSFGEHLSNIVSRVVLGVSSLKEPNVNSPIVQSSKQKPYRDVPAHSCMPLLEQLEKRCIATFITRRLSDWAGSRKSSSTTVPGEMTLTIFLSRSFFPSFAWAIIATVYLHRHGWDKPSGHTIAKEIWTCCILHNKTTWGRRIREETYAHRRRERGRERGKEGGTVLERQRKAEAGRRESEGGPTVRYTLEQLNDEPTALNVVQVHRNSLLCYVSSHVLYKGGIKDLLATEGLPHVCSIRYFELQFFASNICVTFIEFIKLPNLNE